MCLQMNSHFIDAFEGRAAELTQMGANLRMDENMTTKVPICPESLCTDVAAKFLLSSVRLLMILQTAVQGKRPPADVTSITRL